MVRRKMKFNHEEVFRPSITRKSSSETVMFMDEFFNLHKIFMSQKRLQGLALRTIEEHELYMKHFKKFVNTAGRSYEDHAVDINIFRGYLTYLIIEKEYKPNTTNIRLRTLKCYLKWLYDEEHIDKNYSLKIKLVKAPIDTIKPLCDKDVKKMLKTPDKKTYTGYRDFTMMILILDCGIRIGEAVQLEIRDIDASHGFIDVRAEVSKTRTYRQLPISKKTCKLLKELIKISQEEGCKYVFQSQYGGGIKKQNIGLSFRRYGEEAKIKVRTSPYVFRHTFATNAVKAGMDVFTLQRIMGHSNITTTRKYIQLNSDDIKSSHNEVDFLTKFI